MGQEETFHEISSAYKKHNGKTADDGKRLFESINDPMEMYMQKPILLYAASHADHIGIEILLKKGADATWQDDYGSGPLHNMAYDDKRDYAHWADEKKAALLLVEAGASTIKKNSDGATCVHLAAERGKLGMLEAFVSLGKKVDLVSKNGETALHIACDRAVRSSDSYYTYAKANYDKAMAETTDGSEYREKELAEKRQKLKENCDKEWEEVELRFNIVKCLLGAGLDPDQKDNYGKTPKEVAFDCKDVRVSALLNGTYEEGGDGSNGLQMMAKGMDLMQATEKCDHGAAEALLKLGADPNEAYGGDLRHGSFALQGKTPLAAASMLQDLKLVNLLMEHGADPKLKDASGSIPAMYCFMSNYDEKKTIEIIKAMAEKGLNVNTEADDKGNTLLNVTCQDGYSPKLVSQLIRLKADTNIADNEGIVPLMRICAQDRSETEDIQVTLLEAGADVSMKNKNGNTALMFAAQNRNLSRAKTLADMLFEFGNPLPDAVNNIKKTALDFATEQNNENLVSYLLGKM